MAQAQKRTADATWSGSLADGKGTITKSGSGAFSNLPVTWKARTVSSEGMTSTAELIAAALASCFSMALSHSLAQAGNAPAKLEVSATTILTMDAGPKVDSIELNVRGTVDGIDQAAFAKAAEDASQGCPVSTALKGNVKISVNAELAS
ncbi:OsmC family protein [soil metagenome]